MNQQREYQREWRNYLIGLAAALLLTGIAFAVVCFQPTSSTGTLIIIYGLALVQVIVHFRYFLHITLERSARDDLQLILFSALITLLMVGGTLVILFNLHARME